jgi:hypothetical protein
MTGQHVVAIFRPFIRKNEIWIMEFSAQRGVLTSAVL